MRPMTSRRLAALWAYVAAVGASGFAALAITAPALPFERWQELALFFVLAVVAQRMPVMLFRNSSISVTFAIAFGALVSLGPAAATWVQLAAGLVLGVTPRIKPAPKVLFNATSLPLQTYLAGMTYVAIGGQIAPSGVTWTLLPPAIVAITVFVLANTFGLATAISLETGSSLKAVWNLNYRWLLPNYVGLGLVGLGMAASAQVLGALGLVMFLFPLVMAWYSFKLYMAQTQEVRKRNEELQLTNARLDIANSQLNRRVTELNALNKIGLSLNGSLDLGNVLGEIADSALRLVPGQSAAVALADLQSGRLSVASSIGLPEGAVEAIAAFDGSIAQAFVTGQNVVVADASGEPTLTEAGIGALVVMPLRANETTSGVFLVTFASAREVSADEQQLLSTLAQQAATAVHNARLYQEIEAGYLSTVQAMVSVVDARERYQHGHAERVRAYCAAAGSEIGLDQRSLATLELAALFHDLGHIGVPESVLNKPGDLTAEEWSLVRKHPILGVAILKQVPRMEAVVPVILQHHERYDGQGYPEGILGDDASVLSQILAVADAYEAMTSTRPHRPALSREMAVAELQKNSGSQFAPRVVDAFIKSTEESVAVQAGSAEASMLRLLRGESASII